MGIFQSVSVEPMLAFGSFAKSVKMTMVQDLVFTQRCMAITNATEIDSCRTGNIDNSTLLSQIMAEQSGVMSYYFTLGGFVSIPMCFFIGSWTDVFGRKKPLVFPYLLNIFSQICLLISANFIHTNLNWLIYVSGVLDGILGGQTGVLVILFGYISDITSEDNRTKRNVVLESMLFVGGCGGYLFTAAVQYLPNRKFEISFAVLMAIYSLMVIYIIFRIKETRKLEPGASMHVFSFKHVIHCLQTGFKQREVASVRWKLILSIIAVTLVTFCIPIQSNLFYPFLKLDPLRWDTELFSMYNASNQISSGIGMVIVLPLILTYCGQYVKDSHIVIFSCISKAIAFVCLVLATETWHVFITSALFICSDFTLPTIRSSSSKIVGENERGKILSLIGATQNIFNCLGSFIFGKTFSGFTSFPGLVFYVGALFYLLVALIYLVVGCFGSLKGYKGFVDENSNVVGSSGKRTEVANQDPKV